MIKSLHKALLASVVVFGHGFMAATLVMCASATEHQIRVVNGEQEMLFCGRIPLAYLFQTNDVAMIGLLGFSGVREAFRIMRE